MPLLWLLPLFVLLLPNRRRLLVGFLLASGLAAGVWMLLAPPQHELTITHSAPAFVDARIESKSFLVDQRTAPGWQAPALVLLWCLTWALHATFRHRRLPVLDPVLFILAGIAFSFALQWAAAPAWLSLGPLPTVLGPFEYPLLTGLVAAAVLLACRHRLVVAIAWLIVFALLARLPLAALCYYATDHRLGTWADVHRIDFIAAAVTRMPIELTTLEDRIYHLVIVPQLIVMPLLTTLSAIGIAIFVQMLRAHRREQGLRAP